MRILFVPSFSRSTKFPRILVLRKQPEIRGRLNNQMQIFHFIFLRSFRTISLFIIFLLCFGGCLLLTDFPAGMTSNPKGPEYSSTGPILVKVDSKVLTNGKIHPDSQNASLSDQFSYQECVDRSGYAEPLKSSLWDAEFRLDIEDSTTQDFHLLGSFFSTFTLFLVPYRTARDRWTVFDFKDKEGKSLGKFERRYSQAIWWHLFLLFALPYKYFPEEDHNAKCVVITSVMEEATRAGIFKKPVISESNPKSGSIPPNTSPLP